MTERACFGLDIDPRYVDLVVKRWENLTGQQAKLEGDGRTFREIAAERGSSVEEVQDAAS